MESEALTTVHQVFILLVFIFIIGMVSGKLARFLRVPDVAIYMLAGILAGPVLHLVSLPPASALNQFIMIFGAAVILFDGGRGIRFEVLQKVWPTIFLLAVPGVVITAAVTATAASWILGLPLISAWLLAAIIASTDPATLIPVFRQVPIDDKVRQTVESESAFNDATGSILTLTVLGMALGTQAFSISGSILQFIQMAVGGMIVGIIIGWLAAALASVKTLGVLREYPAVLFLTAATASYLVADLLHLSGFMATFLAGVMLGNADVLRQPTSEENTEAAASFFEPATLMFRMMIFILLGSQVNFSSLTAYLLPGLAVVAVFMLIARPLTVLASTLPDRKANWKWKEIVFMFWVRETGVIPAALLGMIAGSGVANIEAISAVTFLAILVTILVQASSTGWVARKLGIAETEPAHKH